MTRPLQPQTSYEFTQFPEQTYRHGRGRPDPLEVIKTLPKENNEGSMLILSTVHPQKWTELIDRWESDAINAIDRISHTLDNISITNFIENLLGTTTKDLLNS